MRSPIIRSFLCIGFLAGVVGLVSVTLARTQQKVLVFEVVSLRPDASSTGLVSIGCHGFDRTDPPRRDIPTGRCVGTRMTAEMALAFAYGIYYPMNTVLKGSIVGEPDWFGKDRFALQAKSDGPATLDEMRGMLQQMLEDRFSLKAHVSTVESDGYAMTIGKNGPELRPAAAGEKESMGYSFRVPRSALLGPTPPEPVARAFDFHALGMEEITQTLASALGRPVINQTGLEGRYTLSTEWARPGDDPNSDYPDMITALQRMGLRLDRQKVQMAIVVIDHVEKPKVD